VEGTVREVKKRVRVVVSSYRTIDQSVTRWIVVTMVEWSSEVRGTLVRRAPGIHLPTEALGPRHGEVRKVHLMLNAALA